MKTALTIAGSDTCAGAGIQADLKTFSANGVYGQTVITALTAQNTMGVNDVLEVPDDFFREEIDAVCSDIFPDAVKIGMVESSAKIRIIFEGIEKYNLMHIVLDPLMISTSGHKLLQDEAVGTLTEMLFPKAELITPNIPEAEELVKDSIDSEEKMRFAAKALSQKYHTNVLIKGGHFDGDPIDVLHEKNGEMHIFYGKRIENKDTHGTGCVLSSAIAANLSKGFSLYEAVSRAREFLQGAIQAGLHLGHGHGPMDLFYKGE